MKFKALIYSLLLSPVISMAQSEIPSDTAMEKHCLSLNIYHESRGEVYENGEFSGSLENWLVVAMITRNRVDNPYYPDGWCRVVYAPYQYSWTHDGVSDEPDLNNPVERKVWREIKVFVEGFMANHRYIKDPTMGAIDYATCSVDNYWTRAYTLFKSFNNHCVYHR